MKDQRYPFTRLEVSAVFQSHPPKVRRRLLALRDLIYATASATPGVGEIVETLKWGQPSYLTTRSKSGTTIRLDYIAQTGEAPEAADEGSCGLYFHCQTNLLTTFRRLHKQRGGNDGTRSAKLAFEGNRCVRVAMRGRLPMGELREFLKLALTYHLRKKKPR
ncbi:MAG: DUF1801 domain-containing protein [Leptospirales bacterium]|jgi:hypothetical protein